MKLSSERILTTHVGSLPRPADVSDMLLAKENGTLADQVAFDACMKNAVADVVRQQVDVGIDIVSDGEMSKIGYSTYIQERLNGFSGDSPRRVPADLALYPDYLQRIAARGETAKIKRALCTGKISIKDEAPLERDIANFRVALAGSGASDGFMNAASPGVISVFQPNRHYPSEDAYLEALAEIMKVEYEAIHAAGFVIQLDCPDLAMGRHMMYPDESDEAFIAHAERQVEALEPRAGVRSCRGRKTAPLLGQLRGAARLRHRARRHLRRGDEGEAAGNFVRSCQPAPRPRVGRLRRARGA